MTMTREIIVFTILLVALVVITFLFFWRDRKRTRTGTLEAMSADLRSEIQEERQVNLEKKNKFEEAMKKAGGE
jgi:uncharacterized protein YpmB